ncbi:MAG: hypothetical protein FJ291_24605 [Planctomycetes bacterium]|nr:hypothetical protein [Planctomycetota bacterium]
MRYGVASWPDTFGNHRARVLVAEKAEAVWTHIPWRRRDRDPEKKHIQVVEAATGREVANVCRAAVQREFGDIAFQPPAAGEYHVYYMPYKIQPNWGWYGGDYLPAKQSADPAWLQANGLAAEQLAQGKWKQLPQAKAVEIQARTEFERLDPMEVPATAEEMKALLAKHPQPYLVFPEDRRFPIRMADELPLRWIERGPSGELRGDAQRNEFYAFQLGIYAARQPLEELAVECSELRPERGWAFPASAVRCFNLGGTDWLGRAFRKSVSVPQGKVQALWFGVDVPRDARPGEYHASVTVRPRGAEPTTVKLTLAVSDNVLEDRGDGEPWRHSRLRWLDSAIALDDDTVPPYPPLRTRGWTVSCLGREVQLDETGFPRSIRCGERELLAAPVSFAVETASGGGKSSDGTLKITKRSPGAVAWEAKSLAEPLAVQCNGSMESDGYLHFSVLFTVHRPAAVREVELRDLRLEIPFRREAATYLMGIGRKGGYRPKEWAWKWGGPIYYDSFWLGDVSAGLWCELRGASYCGPMVNLYWRLKQLAPPETWHNGGKGGVTVGEDGDKVLVRAYSGPRRLDAKAELHFEFALIPTPVKPLNPAKHFAERYWHSDDSDHAPGSVAVENGANVINIHHATPPNPYINYPFLAADKLAAYTKGAHERGAKVKIYYTVRELTNHIVEIWALRSLGHEVLAPGGGGGYPWLREHLGSDYAPAWYHRFPDGDVCAAIVNTGASRWYNYYLEGLAWLLKNCQIDGLYLDDVSYDRNILRRMRKIMERERPGCLIDLHSNTGFSRGPANQYLEFFPYVDRLWFGESFNYNDPPDYWLVEISGIPFGLMGEMLQDGGNRWRGMLYGMTARMPWCMDPKPIWKVWDSFGISEAKMLGYWDPACPVKTNHKDVLATAYVRKGKALIALASWAKEQVPCRLAIDWKALGLNPEKSTLLAPAVEGYQQAADFKPADPIPVPPGRGWMLLLAER